MKTEAETHPFDKLGNPAQRALANAGIKTPEQLAGFTVKEIMKLHGMGKASLPVLNAILATKGLAFKA
jgi:hypothetical protein